MVETGLLEFQVIYLLNTYIPLKSCMMKLRDAEDEEPSSSDHETLLAPDNFTLVVSTSGSLHEHSCSN